MKKIIIAFICFSFLASCGKSKSAKQLAEEVCDCSKKANALPVSDPQRTMAQADCLNKQGQAWNKVKEDNEKTKEFNKILSDCASEQIKKSFGQ